MTGDCHFRIREDLGVRFPRATRLIGSVDVVKFLTSTGSLPQNVNWAIKADYVRRAVISIKSSKYLFFKRGSNQADRALLVFD